MRGEGELKLLIVAFSSRANQLKNDKVIAKGSAQEHHHHHPFNLFTCTNTQT